MTPEIETLITRGVSVRMRHAGSGAPVLFLHGAGGWPAWLPFFERLSQRFALTTPEHPCFGASDDPQWIRDVSDLAMYYLDVLEGAFSSPAHLIGHSLGGWIAAEAAIRNTSRIASLTLLAPAGIRVKGVPPGDNFIWSPEEAIRNRYYNQSFAEALLQAPPPDGAQLDIDLQNRVAAVKFGWEPRWFNPGLENGCIASRCPRTWCGEPKTRSCRVPMRRCGASVLPARKSRRSRLAAIVPISRNAIS
jgi:pimeloyl-ACP methyl ester carboxylesterase